MSNRPSRRYVYDISLDAGAGAHLISWITGLMVFFVTLTLAINFSLSTVTKNWVTGLSGTLTVEIKPPFSATDSEKDVGQKNFNDSIRQVLIFLKDNPAVNEYHLLSETEIKGLIEPWIGQGAVLEAIPLPALIDVKLAPTADVVQLQSNLKTIEPSAIIDSHTNTLDDIKTLIRTANLFMLLLTGIITTLAIVAISGIVRSKLLIHHAEVETLHLIGASDEYIARQFRQHTLRGTLKGALIGTLCTLVSLLVVGMATHTVDSNIFPHLELMSWQWITLMLLPILTGSLIAHLTAQATVLKEISKLP